MKKQFEIDPNKEVPCKVCGEWVKRSDAVSFLEISFICVDCLEKGVENGALLPKANS